MKTLWIRVAAGVLLLGLLAGCDNGPRYGEIIDLTPRYDAAVVANPPRTSRERNAAMLATFNQVQDVPTMTFFGDFDEIIAFQHDQIMRQFGAGAPQEGGTRQGCSMFSYRNGPGESLVGRNFDNVDSGVMVGWFYPQQGYASVALLPLFQLGFTPDDPFDPAIEQHRKSLLYAPVMAIEGINEKGVTVTLASLDRRQTTRTEEKQARFLIHLVREILDSAGSVHEAVNIAERYDVFDNGPETISHHIFLADPHSGSAVLEWRDGSMHLVKDAGDWQVVTNSDMFEVPLETRQRECRRYGSLSDAMAGQEDEMSWQEAMDALAAAKQKNRNYTIDGQTLKVSTQWSAVFDTGRREMVLSLGGDYGRVYRARVEPLPTTSD